MAGTRVRQERRLGQNMTGGTQACTQGGAMQGRPSASCLILLLALPTWPGRSDTAPGSSVGTESTAISCLPWPSRMMVPSGQGRKRLGPSHLCPCRDLGMWLGMAGRVPGPLVPAYFASSLQFKDASLMTSLSSDAWPSDLTT